MLRSKKLRPFEVKRLFAIPLLFARCRRWRLILGLYRAEWRLVAASVAIDGLAALYLSAARRGQLFLRVLSIRAS